jgi:hypothetical protein
MSSPLNTHYSNPQEVILSRLESVTDLASFELVDIPPDRHKPAVQEAGFLGRAPHSKLAGEVLCNAFTSAQGNMNQQDQAHSPSSQSSDVSS